MRWIVEAGEFVGITFRDIDHGSESVGRYR
jgi:hypothetical protein